MEIAAKVRTELRIFAGEAFGGVAIVSDQGAWLAAAWFLDISRIPPSSCQHPVHDGGFTFA